MLKRIREPELMDDPRISEERHFGSLRALARANELSGVPSMMWQAIHRLYKEFGNQPLRVLDLGSGGGDVPIGLRYRAIQEGANIGFDGSDSSARCVEFAQEQAQTLAPDVGFFKIDAVKDDLPDGYDVLMCSQFMHHLDPPEIVDVLRKMREKAGRLVVINDIRRSYDSLLTVRLAGYLIRDELFRYDGPVSVHAAFTRREWMEMTSEAGLDNCVLKPFLPCHLMITWERR